MLKNLKDNKNVVDYLQKRAKRISLVIAMGLLVGCGKNQNEPLKESAVILDLPEDEHKSLPSTEEVYNLLCEKNTGDLLVSNLIPNIPVNDLDTTKSSYDMISDFYNKEELATPFFYQEVALLNAMQKDGYKIDAQKEIIMAQKENENYYIRKEWFLSEKRNSKTYENLEIDHNTTNYANYVSYYSDFGNDNCILIGTDYSNGENKLIINLYPCELDIDYDNPMVFSAPINSNAELLEINSELMNYYTNEFDFSLLKSSTIGKIMQKQNPYMYDYLFQILETLTKESKKKIVLS